MLFVSNIQSLTYPGLNVPFPLSPPFPFSSFFLSSPSYPFHPSPIPPLSLLLSLPLEIGPPIAVRASGGTLKLLQRVRSEPGRQTYFDAFWHKFAPF